jgi:hypothetical protein
MDVVKRSFQTQPLFGTVEEVKQGAPEREFKFLVENEFSLVFFIFWSDFLNISRQIVTFSSSCTFSVVKIVFPWGARLFAKKHPSDN